MQSVIGGRVNLVGEGWGGLETDSLKTGLTPSPLPLRSPSPPPIPFNV